MLTERCYVICKYLFDQNEPVTIKQLSDSFFVSQRTIRYDLDYINQWLNDRGIILTKKSNVGVFIDHNQKEYAEVKEFFNNPAEVQQAYTAEERQMIIRGLLLQANKLYSIYDLALKCNVSKSTVTADLNALEKWFKSYNITLVRKPNHGIELKFDEKNWRNAVVNHIYEVHDKEKLISLLDVSKLNFNNESRLSIITQSEIFEVIGDTDMNALEKCISEIEKEMNISFTDAALAGLLVHLGVAVNRIKIGKEIKMPKDKLDALKTLPEFEVSKKALKKIQKVFGIVFPVDEAGYFAMHIMGAGINKIQTIASENEVINKFINEVSKELGIDLMDDKDLYDGLLTHIKPAISRAKYDIKLFNPLLDRIMENYAHIFEVVKKKSKILNKYYRIDLDDNELGYLVVHFGAAIERHKKIAPNSTLITAAVVCGSGLGTTKMLSSKIRSEFSEINILYEMSITDFEKFDKNSVDVVFTTLPLEIEENDNILFVNAFLTEYDKTAIRNYISKYFSLENNHDNFYDKLIDIIKRNCDVKNEKGLKHELTTMLQYSRNESNKDKKTLLNFLDEKHIKVNVKAEDYKQAIEEGGKILVENKDVAPEYIGDMIKIVDEYKAYCVVTKGFAMPHADKTHALKTAFSLITLEKPVKFNHKYNDPVSVVLCMSATDEKQQDNALEDLIKLLEDKNFLKYLNKCNSPKEVINVIKQIELLNR